ncbi:MAG: IPT/TIG domain-containing protein [Acidobacteria bacterium]|nr:IPT/TIG domain-containing protein [Acidobacteriota bacterium]
MRKISSFTARHLLIVCGLCAAVGLIGSAAPVAAQWEDCVDPTGLPDSWCTWNESLSPTTVQAGAYLSLSFDTDSGWPCASNTFVSASYADPSRIVVNGVPVTGTPTFGGTGAIYVIPPFSGIQHFNIVFGIDGCAPTDCVKPAGGGYVGPFVTIGSYATGWSTVLPFRVEGDALMLSSVTPDHGPTAGNTQVEIKGAGFANGAAVTFGGTPGTSVTVVDCNTLRVRTPAHAAGRVGVTVTNPGAQAASLGSGYQYMAPLVITSISPTEGPTDGGTAVTVMGGGFLTGATLTLGGVAANSVFVVSQSTMTAVTSAHAKGKVDVVVTNPDSEKATLVNGYEYTAGADCQLGISQVAPASGMETGGDLVTIYGDCFADGATVTFGSTPAAVVNWINSQQMTAVTPPHAPAVVDVTVTNPDSNSATLPLAYTYLQVNYYADMEITKTGRPNPVTLGHNLTYIIKVVNQGPDNATGVTVTDRLPAKAAFGSAIANQGTWSLNDRVLTWYAGGLDKGAMTSLKIVVVPVRPGTISNTATVVASEVDSDASNNTVTLSGTVNVEGMPDLAPVWKSAKVADGQISAVVRASNLGTVSSGPFAVKVWLSRTASSHGKKPVKTQEILNVKAGGVSEPVVIHCESLPGYKYLIAEVDTEDTVNESDDSNNVEEKQVQSVTPGAEE